MLEFLKKAYDCPHGEKLDSLEALVRTSEIEVDVAKQTPVGSMVYGHHPIFGRCVSLVAILGPSYFVSQIVSPDEERQAA